MRFLTKFLLLVTAISCSGFAVPSFADDPQPRIKLTAGAFAAPGSPWDMDWQQFSRDLTENSGGEAKVKLLIRAETGGEPATMSAIRRNRIQFGGFTLGGASAIVPELSMLLTPFFFDTFEELDYVMDEHLLEVFRPLFAEKNLFLVSWTDVGWAHFYGRRPILRPRDAEGYSLRSQASEASQILMQSLGGDMLQMPFSDVIPALQTGLVEGGETNIILYGITGLDGEAPHITLTRHSYDSGVVVANYKWFMSLSEADRAMVLESYPKPAASRVRIRGFADKVDAAVRAKPDVTIHSLTAEQRQEWVSATKGNAQRIIQEIGGQAAEVYQAMLEGRQDYRENIAKMGAAP